MAITVPRRRPKDPEGRMPLRAHLAELRNRLVKAGLAIIVGAVLGWFVYDWLYVQLQQPLIDAAKANNVPLTINFPDITSAFNLHLKLAVYVGIVLASPVWLFQLWAFILPGLTRRERNYAFGFAFFAVLLFNGGIALAWMILPNAVDFFAGFVPDGSSAFNTADGYIGFVTRLLLTFGVAFVVPLVLVGMNMIGMISAMTMAKGWRIAVFLCFLFAAMASPTAEVSMMFLLALPMVFLYLVAVGVAWFVDRRRARAADRAVGDGEASEVERPEAIERPDAL
jgi:sec-independent protein translocase protein TatC